MPGGGDDALDAFVAMVKARAEVANMSEARRTALAEACRAGEGAKVLAALREVTGAGP